VNAYAKTVTEHLRITLLRLLLEAPAYTLNESLLTDLTESYGFTPSRDRTRTELAWLNEQGLVALGGPEHCMTARLTTRGADVAQGRTTVPGVKRPEPGDR
jgi:hypothetical protein